MEPHVSIMGDEHKALSLHRWKVVKNNIAPFTDSHPLIMVEVTAEHF